MKYYTVESIKEAIKGLSYIDASRLLDSIDDIVLIELCIADPYFEEFNEVLLNNIKDDYIKYQLFFKVSEETQKFLLHQINSDLIKINLLLDEKVSEPLQIELIKYVNSLGKEDVLYNFYVKFKDRLSVEVWKLLMSLFSSDTIVDVFMVEKDKERLKYLVSIIKNRNVLLSIYNKLNIDDFRKQLLNKMFIHDWRVE